MMVSTVYVKEIRYVAAVSVTYLLLDSYYGLTDQLVFLFCSKAGFVFMVC